MGIYQNLAGRVRVRLTSADPGGTLAAIGAAGIPIREVRPEDALTCSFTVARWDYRKLRAIARRRGDLLHPVARLGIYWDLKGLRRRPVFVFGIAFLLAMAMFLPSRVLLIEVQGNRSVPAGRILEAAGECGITFGSSRRQVRSEHVKNALLEAMPELAWAGVNTYGCRAVISVREREPEPDPADQAEVTNIVAARDGYILSCNVVSGSGLCVPGQAVKAGEVLISGFTDCGICVSATRAEGEVMASTSHSLTAVTPAECLQKTAVTGKTVRYSLIVGKNRLNFDKNSGISGAGCGRMVTNYHLTLPGLWRLPVTLVKETVSAYDLSTAGKDAAALEGFAARCLGTRMIAGTVTDAVELVTEEDGLWVLRGDYACTEMIGRVRAVQNGELHETS